MLVIILAIIIIIIISLALNSIYNKINIEQKGKRERWIINSISILSVFFLMFFIRSPYYRIYDIESFLEQLFYNLKVSFMVALINMIIYQPIFLILDNLKKKNIYKIVLAIILIIIIDFIIFIRNFSLTF